MIMIPSRPVTSVMMEELWEQSDLRIDACRFWNICQRSLLMTQSKMLSVWNEACQWAHIQVKLHRKYYSSLSKGFDNYVLKGLLANCVIHHGLGVTQIADHSVLIYLLILNISSDYKIPFLLASINTWTCDLSSIFGLKW
jgi:hypothetical protein